MATCIQLGLPVVVLIITFAFYMRRIKIFGCALGCCGQGAFPRGTCAPL